MPYTYVKPKYPWNPTIGTDTGWPWDNAGGGGGGGASLSSLQQSLAGTRLTTIVSDTSGKSVSSSVNFPTGGPATLGWLRVTDTVNSTLDASTGTAASPKTVFKLGGEVDSVRDDLTAVQRDVQNTRNSISSVSSDVASLSTSLENEAKERKDADATLKGEIDAQGVSIGEMESDVARAKTASENLQKELDEVKGDVSDLKDGVAENAGNVSGLRSEFDVVKTDFDAFVKSKAQNGGLAPLGEDGIVPTSYLPSYVDAVLEYDGFDNFPPEGQSNEIYLDTRANLSYRWGGTQYVQIGQSVALGETSSTAYPGDKGKKNAEDISGIKADVASIQKDVSDLKDLNLDPSDLAKLKEDNVFDKKNTFNDTVVVNEIDDRWGNLVFAVNGNGSDLKVGGPKKVLTMASSSSEVRLDVAGTSEKRFVLDDPGTKKMGERVSGLETSLGSLESKVGEVEQSVKDESTRIGEVEKSVTGLDKADVKSLEMNLSSDNVLTTTLISGNGDTVENNVSLDSLVTKDGLLRSAYAYSLDVNHYAYVDVTTSFAITRCFNYQFAVSGRDGDYGVLGLATTDGSRLQTSFCTWFKKYFEQEVMGAKLIDPTHWRIFVRSRNYCTLGFTPLFQGVESIVFSTYQKDAWTKDDWDKPCYNPMVSVSLTHSMFSSENNYPSVEYICATGSTAGFVEFESCCLNGGTLKRIKGIWDVKNVQLYITENEGNWDYSAGLNDNVYGGASMRLAIPWGYDANAHNYKFTKATAWEGAYLTKIEYR